MLFYINAMWICWSHTKLQFSPKPSDSESEPQFREALVLKVPCGSLWCQNRDPSASKNDLPVIMYWYKIDAQNMARGQNLAKWQLLKWLNIFKGGNLLLWIRWWRSISNDSLCPHLKVRIRLYPCLQLIVLTKENTHRSIAIDFNSIRPSFTQDHKNGLK